MEKDLKILYEDNHLLAVFKPAGILVQGDKSGERSLFEMAKNYLRDKYKKPAGVYLGLVHRLDRGTSGVLVFAKTSKAANRLSAEFRERRVKKVYMAVVEGIPPSKASLNHMLLRDRKRGISSIVEKPAPGAQIARLSYRVMEKKRGFSLLEIIPETGRHHQIRLQLASCGYPIAGDRTYGSRTKPAGGKIKLFAREISFAHPVKKEKITVKADIPPDFFKV